MRRYFHPCVEDFYFFQRRNIVVNDHAFRADDGHFPYLPGIEPAALHQCRAVLAECQMNVGHIFDAWRDMGFAAAIYADRNFVEDVKDDRDVVRSEVPGNIDVLLKKAQVQAARTDITDVANVATINDLFDLSDGWRIQKGVAYHQNEPLLLGNMNKFFAFLRG